MTTIARPVPTASGYEQHFTSVADIIRDRLPAYGKRPAIRYDDGCTYKTLDFIAYVGNIRRALQVVGTGGSKQQIICTCVQNRPEWDMMAMASL